MPSAFKNAGLAIGTIGVMLAGTIVTHSIHILVKTSQELCVIAEKPSMSFAETCGAAFTYGPEKLHFLGPFIEKLADFCLSLAYTGVLCIYVVFIAESLKEVFDSLIPSMHLATEKYCAIILLPLILICQIRSLKYVTPFSFLANIGIFVVFAITLSFMLTDLPSPSERKLVAPLSTWPLFISIVVFAIEGIGVVVPVENEMASPQNFLGCPGVLNITMSIVITLYGLVGFLGYVKYGEEVKGSITLSLPQDSSLALGTKLLMAVVIFFTYTLAFYVPMEMITRRLHEKNNKQSHNLIQITVRTILVTLSVVVAALVPSLELVISLVGSIFFSTCGILLPTLVETVYRWNKNLGRHNYILWKNIALFCTGIITMVSGSLTALSAIATEHSEDLDDYGYNYIDVDTED